MKFGKKSFYHHPVAAHSMAILLMGSFMVSQPICVGAWTPLGPEEGVIATAIKPGPREPPNDQRVALVPPSSLCLRYVSERYGRSNRRLRLRMSKLDRDL